MLGMHTAMKQKAEFIRKGKNSVSMHLNLTEVC